MKSKLFAIALTLLPVVGNAAEIASVNFKAIKDDLREYYFAKPENAEIKEKFTSAVREEKAFQDDMQKKIMDGNKPIDIRSAIPKGGMSERYQLEKKIDGEIKKELYLIVVGLGLKYELIYDSSDSETVLYAKSQVDDITTTVKQAIIELGKKK
jgi:Skp family chaperone for outer membrane proteins